MPILGTHTATEREAFIQEWIASHPDYGKNQNAHYSSGRKRHPGKIKTLHRIQRQEAARLWAKKVRKEMEEV